MKTIVPGREVILSRKLDAAYIDMSSDIQIPIQTSAHLEILPIDPCTLLRYVPPE